MKIEGNIGYEMNVDKDNAGIAYEANINTDLAALLISAQSLQNALEGNKRMKKEAADPNIKKAIGRNISEISRGLASINRLAYTMIVNYDKLVKLQTKEQ